MPRAAARPASAAANRGRGQFGLAQAVGAVHYRTSLAVSLIVPGLLSCLTLLTPQSGCLMLVQLVGGLVFYSFLLLPTALKFDFRRDIDRLATLKALPISPLAVTLGQLTMPVFLCTLFQIVVLLVALALRPYHLALFIAAMLVLARTNVLIFALENLIFLLYPYRLNQEGLGVFFRSILAFTAKSILFAGCAGVGIGVGICFEADCRSAGSAQRMGGYVRRLYRRLLVAVDSRGLWCNGAVGWRVSPFRSQSGHTGDVVAPPSGFEDRIMSPATEDKGCAL